MCYGGLCFLPSVAILSWTAEMNGSIRKKHFLKEPLTSTHKPLEL